jgi:hypothetical protein
MFSALPTLLGTMQTLLSSANVEDNHSRATEKPLPPQVPSAADATSVATTPRVKGRVEGQGLSRGSVSEVTSRKQVLSAADATSVATTPRVEGRVEGQGLSRGSVSEVTSQKLPQSDSVDCKHKVSDRLDALCAFIKCKLMLQYCLNIARLSRIAS